MRRRLFVAGRTKHRQIDIGEDPFARVHGDPPPERDGRGSPKRAEMRHVARLGGSSHSLVIVGDSAPPSGLREIGQRIVVNLVLGATGETKSSCLNSGGGGFTSS